MRANQTGIDAAYADGVDADFAANAEDLRVYQTVEHHAGDLDGFRIGHATARNYLRFYSKRLLNFSELRSATMHDDNADADLMQDADLFHQRARR